jgi:hypothetical protein
LYRSRIRDQMLHFNPCSTPSIMPPSFTHLTPSMTTLSNHQKQNKGKCKHRNSFKNRNYKLLLFSHTTDPPPRLQILHLCPIKRRDGALEFSCYSTCRFFYRNEIIAQSSVRPLLKNTYRISFCICLCKIVFYF